MSSPHSILIVGNFLSRTLGSRSVCEDLAEHLAEAGWTVFTTSSQPGRISRLLDMLQTVWRRRDQFDLATIDTFSGPAFFWAELVGYLLMFLRKPFVLILHGGNLPDFATRHPGRVKQLLGLAALVSAPSRYLLEGMQPYRSDLVLVPNPIDIQKFKFIPRKQPHPILIWLRAFHSIYNAPLAIRALGILAADHPDIRLLMGGGDTDDGSLQKVNQLTKVLGLPERVEIFGKIPHDEVPAWLQKGDIFINTTNVDNTPVSVLEAMACGLCIVSTNVGGIPNLLDDEQEALLVPVDDSQSMALAVQRVLIEPGLAEKLSINARQKAAQFDWSVILPQWETLFNKMIEKRGTTLTGEKTL